VLFLPVAVVPLWQVEQLPVTELWSNRADVHVLVLWQSSQVLPLAMWVLFLPVAVVPLWQVEQLPVTELWSNRADVHVPVLWQSSQVLPLVM
jgi:hypothetical protein